MRVAPYSLLLPAPREVSPSEGELALAKGASFDLEASERVPQLAGERLVEAFADLDLILAAGRQDAPVVRLVAGNAGGTRGESYDLVVARDGIRIEGAGPVGVLHGTATLVQLLRLSKHRGALPCAAIKDAPAFERRGWMLDVSRDRVPTMDSLRAVVDLLASLKGNELQLYVEHTFAYEGHEEVWRGTGALTPDEVRALDAYCAARGVELVPNQNCLGHLHHWLTLDRYRDLAEVPEGVDHPFSAEKEPFSLCPTDPRSLALVAELVDQLLPCFRSREVNVGLDETFDIGMGRSKSACDANGTGRVYLAYLIAVNKLVRDRGHRMQFWADVLLEHPELVPEVPRDAIAMLWGYEATHPFDEQARQVAASGLPFTVCPGTSSWQSLGGRTENMAANIDKAVQAGLEHGARGVLVTDWGDRGHLQPEWASYAGWALGAGLSWNASPPDGSDPRDLDLLAQLLDAHVFIDEAGRLGGLALALGRAGEVTGAHAPNASVLSLLITAFDQSFPPEQLSGLTSEGLEEAVRLVDAALEGLPVSRCSRPDARLIADEMTWVGSLQRFAARFGLARLHAGGDLDDIDSEVRNNLAFELERLTDEHRRLWLARCRREGLQRSAAWLERLTHALSTRA